MKTKRAMILVSTDPESIRLGANELLENLKEALDAYQLIDEVDIATIADTGRSNILPVVVVYPEATIYGPVKPGDARYLVEEHLYKGRTVEDLLAPPKELTGQIGSLRANKGYNPAEQRIVLERAFVGFLHPVIVNADLADGDHFGMLRQFLHLLEGAFGKLIQIGGMEPDRRIHARI